MLSALFLVVTTVLQALAVSPPRPILQRPHTVFEIWTQKSKLCAQASHRRREFCQPQCRSGQDIDHSEDPNGLEEDTASINAEGLNQKCQQMAKQGFCEEGGPIMQLCADWCYTCSALPGMNVIFNYCGDSVGSERSCRYLAAMGGCSKSQSPYGGHGLGLARRMCAGTCKFCEKSNATTGKVQKFSDPTKCFDDVTFSTFNRDQQLSIACNCWGLAHNVYSGCCMAVWRRYFPGEPGSVDCSLVRKPSYLGPDPENPVDFPFDEVPRKQCCHDSQCGNGGRCLCGHIGGGHWLSCNRAAENCEGQCVF